MEGPAESAWQAPVLEAASRAPACHTPDAPSLARPGFLLGVHERGSTCLQPLAVKTGGGPQFWLPPHSFVPRFIPW